MSEMYGDPRMLGGEGKSRAAAASMLAFLLLQPNEAGWRRPALRSEEGTYEGPVELTIRGIAARLAIPYATAKKRWNRLAELGWVDSVDGLVGKTHAPKVKLLYLTDKGYREARGLVDECEAKRYVLYGKDAEDPQPIEWERLKEVLGESNLDMWDLFEYWHEIGPWEYNVIDVPAMAQHKEQARESAKRSNLNSTPWYLKPFARAILRECRAHLTRDAQNELDILVRDYFDGIFAAVFEHSFDSEGKWREPRPIRRTRDAGVPLLPLSAMQFAGCLTNLWLSPSTEEELENPVGMALDDLHALDLPEQVFSSLTRIVHSMSDKDALSGLFETIQEEVEGEGFHGGSD